jgi:hypothetical protein
MAGARSGRYRGVPELAQALPDFNLTDGQWDDLRIPIGLAFFCRQSTTGQVAATYPSPAGPVESLLTLEAWRELEDANPILRELEADVEALLVNRVGSSRDYYRIGIDQCFKLVGLVRQNWHGLSGGVEVWEAVAGFLRQFHKAGPAGVSNV